MLNVIDGLDWEAIDGDKEGMADVAAPLRDAGDGCRR